MTLSPVMHDIPAIKTASASPAPITLQEQSNVIERLATAIAAKALDPHPLDQYCFILIDTVCWGAHRPQPLARRVNSFTMSKNGCLYQCRAYPGPPVSYGWVIISTGLEAALNQQPHTYGFAQMDAEEIRNHIDETVDKWLRVNYDHPTRALVMVNGTPSRPNLDNPYATGMHGLIADLRVVSASQRIPFSVRMQCADLLNGCSQSMTLCLSLMATVTALCQTAPNPPPEGGGRWIDPSVPNGNNPDLP